VSVQSVELLVLNREQELLVIDSYSVVGVVLECVKYLSHPRIAKVAYRGRRLIQVSLLGQRLGRVDERILVLSEDCSDCIRDVLSFSDDVSEVTRIARGHHRFDAALARGELKNVHRHLIDAGIVPRLPVGVNRLELDRPRLVGVRVGRRHGHVAAVLAVELTELHANRVIRRQLPELLNVVRVVENAIGAV